MLSAYRLYEWMVQRGYLFEGALNLGEVASTEVKMNECQIIQIKSNQIKSNGSSSPISETDQETWICIVLVLKRSIVATISKEIHHNNVIEGESEKKKKKNEKMRSEAGRYYL